MDKEPLFYKIKIKRLPKWTSYEKCVMAKNYIEATRLALEEVKEDNVLKIKITVLNRKKVKKKNEKS